jgi:hypothetical protein
MASVSISVKHDIDQALAQFETLASNLRGQAVVRALNRVGAMAKTEASRQIRAEYKMKASDVNAAITVRRASVRSTTIEVDVVAKGRHSVPLVNFSATQTKTGVSVTIKRSSGRKKFGGAFIATMKNGHRGVFKRRTKSRLPIDEIFTIGVPYQFAARKTVDAMQRIVRDKFPERLLHELEQAMKRQGGGA